MTIEAREKFPIEPLYPDIDPEYVYMGVKKDNYPKQKEAAGIRFPKGDGTMPLPKN